MFVTIHIGIGSTELCFSDMLKSFKVVFHIVLFKKVNTFGAVVFSSHVKLQLFIFLIK